MAPHNPVPNCFCLRALSTVARFVACNCICLSFRRAAGDFETAVCELVLAGSDVNSTHTLPNRNNDLVNGVSCCLLAPRCRSCEALCA